MRARLRHAWLAVLVTLLISPEICAEAEPTPESRPDDESKHESKKNKGVPAPEENGESAHFIDDGFGYGGYGPYDGIGGYGGYGDLGLPPDAIGMSPGDWGAAAPHFGYDTYGMGDFDNLYGQNYLDPGGYGWPDNDYEYEDGYGHRRYWNEGSESLQLSSPAAWLVITSVALLW